MGVESSLNWIKLFDKLSNECEDRSNRSSTLSKALKKVETLSNERRIKFGFDQTFARRPYDFSLSQTWVVSKPFEHFIQLLIDKYLTFTPHWSKERAKVETVSKPGLKVSTHTRGHVGGTDEAGQAPWCVLHGTRAEGTVRKLVHKKRIEA